MLAKKVTFTATNKPIPMDKGSFPLGCLPEMAKDPLMFFKRLADENKDIVDFRLGTVTPALVLSPELAHQILVKEIKHFRKGDRDSSIFSNTLGKGLVPNNDFENHKVQRKLVQPGFHFRRIEAYAKVMSEYTEQYIANWVTGGTRDIADDMYKLTMYIVSKTLFNIDKESLENGTIGISKIVDDIQQGTIDKLNSAFIFPDWLPTPNNRKLAKARAGMEKVINSMIESRTPKTDEPGDDMMSMLLEAKYDDGSKMSRKLVMDELINLFVAGHETTSNALSWTLHYLSLHPQYQLRLQQELDEVLGGNTPKFTNVGDLIYTEMVFKEAMRIVPPAWTLNSRQANKDITVGEYFFPKDKVIFISPYAHHHNTRHFKNPEVFDPERFSAESEKRLPKNAYIPFGTGPRVCIGKSFAMMEAKIILASILQKFDVKAVESQKIETQAQITVSNKGGLNLIFQKRSVVPVKKEAHLDTTAIAG